MRLVHLARMGVLGGSATALVCLPRLYRMAFSRPGQELSTPQIVVSIERSALDAQDVFRDGTPNFLPLNSAPDQEAFRNWFTLLAEYQALRPAQEVPSEISDCAALLRYAYRNALRKHDEAWFRENRMEPPTALPSVEKYHYPFTPLRAALFRVRPGTFRMTDLADGTFSEFADAKTLEQLNTFLVSRDVRMARPGDLLFYRQLEQDSPFHSMVLWAAANGLTAARKMQKTSWSTTRAGSTDTREKCAVCGWRNYCGTPRPGGGQWPATAIFLAFTGGIF